MTLFLALAAVLALLTLGAVLAPLFVRARLPESRDAKDARLFRQQLAEVDRDLERGVIREAEAEGARAEISRRLIAAVEAAEASKPAAPAPRGATGLIAGLALIGLPLIAVASYLAGGAPGEPDQPFAARGLEPTIEMAGRQPPRARPSQTEAEENAPAPVIADTEEAKQFRRLINQLEAVVKERGDEPQGLALLANGYMRLGRPADAWPVYERLAAVQGDEAPAGLHALQAEAMVLAAGGYVSPQAEQAVARALALDPLNPVARYYSAIADAQGGRIGEALAAWRALRADTPDTDPLAQALDAMIGEATAMMQGAPALPGPSGEDIEAAGEMSAEDRQAMIAGMVQRLEDRLTSEGGEAEEWLRLMTSYDRLGRPEDARRAYQLGREALGSEGGASFLREQALVMGIISE